MEEIIELPYEQSPDQLLPTLPTDPEQMRILLLLIKIIPEKQVEEENT